MSTLRISRILTLIAVLAVAVPGITGCGSSDEPGPVNPPGDTTPPSVASVRADRVDHITVAFNEPVTKASAENTANYVIVEVGPVPAAERTAALAGDIQVLGATLLSGGRTVELVTEPMDPFMSYTVQVSNVEDAAGNSNDDDPVEVKSEIKSGRIYTVAGTGLNGRGGEDMDPLLSELSFPQDMREGPDGIMYILDWNNHRVRIIQDGLIHTIIGTGDLGPAEPDMSGSDARQIGLNHPTHVSFDPNGMLCLSAWHNSKVLKMNVQTGLIYPYCAISGARSFGGDGGPALNAKLNLPTATAFDPQGRMYISDQANQRIRRIDTNDIITTAIGVGTRGYSGDGGPASEAELSQPVGQAAPPAGRITFDSFGKLYICDSGNHVIRMVDTNGIIHTVAGTGKEKGFGGDGGAATAALLHTPTDVEFDADGNMYIADWLNHCVRKVDNAGIITTVAGQGGQKGYDGDGGRATDALLFRPTGIAFDSDGNLWIADSQNHVIRVVYK